MVERYKHLAPGLLINSQGGGILSDLTLLDQLQYWNRDYCGSAFSNPPLEWIKIMENMSTYDKKYTSRLIGEANRSLSRLYGVANPALEHIRESEIDEMSNWTIRKKFQRDI